MEGFSSRILYLLLPAPIFLVCTAVAVTYISAHRALNYEKEIGRNLDLSEGSITLDRYQALMIPIMSSCTLLLMFYLFSSISQFITLFTAMASVLSLFFFFHPCVGYLKTWFCLVDPYVFRCCLKTFTRMQGLLLLLCTGTVMVWLVSGHWILNNLLGVSLCVAFVCHVRLPDVKTCLTLFTCLFLYDIFWVFYSEKIFGKNVMVTVSTQQASNPVYNVASQLSLPGFHLIMKKIDLPLKIIFPVNLLTGGESSMEFIMLGLGDMAIPSMFTAFVLCFDHKKNSMVKLGKRGGFYVWYAISGYTVGLIVTLFANVFTLSPQPALLYLVPCSLVPVMVVSWRRNELGELWRGFKTKESDKVHTVLV